jgi:hypothetical protein
LFPFSSKQQKIKIKIKMKLISQSYSSRLKVPVVLRPTIARSDVVIMHALFPSSIAVKGYILPGLLSVVSKHISIKKTGQTPLKPTVYVASSKTNKAG